MKCPHCGADANEGTILCPACYRRMDGAAPPPEAGTSPVEAHLMAGNKIAAIKAYREKTGLGLAESKYAVELVEQKLREAGRMPAAPPRKAGCLGLLILAGALLCLFL